MACISNILNWKFWSLKTSNIFHFLKCDYVVSLEKLIYKCAIVRFHYKFVIIVLFSTVKIMIWCIFPKQIYCCIEGIDYCKIFSDKDDIKIVSISTVNSVSHISIVQYFLYQAVFLLLFASCVAANLICGSVLLRKFGYFGHLPLVHWLFR